MLEKTMKFLKKEIGERAEQNDDYYLTNLSVKLGIVNSLISRFSILMYADMGKLRYLEEKRKKLYTFMEKIFLENPKEYIEGYYEGLLYNDSKTLRSIKLLLVTEYKVPCSPLEVYFDAIIISFYYNTLLPNIGFHSLATDARVDLALLKIALDLTNIMNFQSGLNVKTDQSEPGAKQKEKNGLKNREAITKTLEDFKIPNLQIFRNNKKLRKCFVEKAKEMTTLHSEKRIFDLAREVLKEKTTL